MNPTFDWKRLLALGTGIGIEIRGEDLTVAIVKSRLQGVTVIGRTTIAGFRQRPAAEWGKEYETFLRGHGVGDLPATLALPRAEVIVRLLNLPAMSRSELSSAVGFQLDGLHPYGDEAVYHSFSALTATGPSLPVAVVIAPRTVVDAYADLFDEAGIKLRGMTVSAAGYHSASRLLRGRAPAPFLLADQRGAAYEIYGESERRPFFSASFDSRLMPLEKAIAAASAELRFEDETTLPLLVCGDRSIPSPLAAEEVFGSPLQAPAEFELARDAAVFATALAGAGSHWGWRVNLLPRTRRSSTARWPMAATAAAGVAVAAVALALSVRGPVQDSRYLRALNREVKQLESAEREIRALERQTQKSRERRAQLDRFRRRAETDLALMTELSRRIPKAVWLNGLDMTDDTIQLSGRADAAAPLLGLLDSSGMLTNAAFISSIAREQNQEVFRIRAARRTSPVVTVSGPAAPAPATPAAIPAATPAHQAAPPAHPATPPSGGHN